MEFASIINPLINLENNMASLYEYFGLRFKDNPDAGILFRKMKREELSHADLLKFQKRTLAKNKEKLNPVDIDVECINEVSSWIESFLAKKPELSLEKALELALKIERNAAESHYRTAVKSVNPELGELVEKLGGYDKDHSQRLVDFAREHQLDVSV